MFFFPHFIKKQVPRRELENRARMAMTLGLFSQRGEMRDKQYIKYNKNDKFLPSFFYAQFRCKFASLMLRLSLNNLQTLDAHLIKQNINPLTRRQVLDFKCLKI